jgi:predicted transcriptional regulator
MNTPRTISFRIDTQKVDELDGIAKSMDRDRSYLLNEAVDIYLNEQRRFAAMAVEGLEASGKGQTLSHEDVGRMVDEWERKNR